jgi:hypothetical protein
MSGSSDRAVLRQANRAVALSVLLVGLVVAIAIAAALAPALFPAGDQIDRESQGVAAGVIFVGSYLALAIGRIPGLSIDRAGIALVGAGLMVASGALALEDAYKAIDLDTIIEAELPTGNNGRESAPFRRTMIAQDTGSAIAGP